jgi:hypothetical protein
MQGIDLATLPFQARSISAVPIACPCQPSSHPPKHGRVAHRLPGLPAGDEPARRQGSLPVDKPSSARSPVPWLAARWDTPTRRHLSSAGAVAAKMSTRLLRPDRSGRHSFPVWIAAPPSISFPKLMRPHCACRMKATTTRPLPYGSGWRRPQWARCCVWLRRSCTPSSPPERRACDLPSAIQQPARERPGSGCITQQQFRQATDRGHHRRKDQEALRCFFPSGLTSFSAPRLQVRLWLDSGKRSRSSRRGGPRGHDRCSGFRFHESRNEEDQSNDNAV